VVLETGRALVPPSGFTYGRAGVRWRALQAVWASADSALYWYDVPVRGHPYSLTGVASLEWAPLPRVKTLASALVMTTPYSTLEVQGLVRAVFELGTVAEGSTP
jgi:hypothetical protein